MSFKKRKLLNRIAVFMAFVILATALTLFFFILSTFARKIILFYI